MTIPTNLRTESARSAAERMATKLIAANDNTPPKGRAPVYRGGRPAWNWGAKQDQHGAAALWLVARNRLPSETANDNEPQQGGLDVRRNGVARGKSKAKSNLGAHLALPAVLPRLGDGEREPVEPCGYTRQDILPQNDIEELSDDFRSFGSCADAVAPGASFIGAESGLGQPKLGKSRGDVRRVEDPTFDEPPSDIDYTIELILSRANLAEIGEALGYTGRYRDKAGAKAVVRAMDWAKAQVAESNFRASVTNCVA
ncbi:hypothetical protein [Sinorhizobium medicae]|uniref:hypothetical protein n=1 Tax=Sinorhizobium medicae TaxID=110321 RepID=UPI000FDA7163|nr:hypothetical protein [Sinorhizobium medicae]RVJ82619.1 hypothetical protein CN168_10420 [Sinorhizobium medicae]